MRQAPHRPDAQQPTYPRAFITPEDRVVSIGAMAKALSVIRQNPDAYYPGWNWFSTPGHFILAEFRRGLHDRINRRVGIGRKTA